MMHCYRYKIGIFAIAGVLLSDIKSILVEVWNTQEHLQEHGEKIYVIAQDDNGKLCAKSMANIIHVKKIEVDCGKITYTEFLL